MVCQYNGKKWILHANTLLCWYFSANEIGEYSFRLSIGFRQIFLEFNPVDIRIHAVDPWIPAVAAVEEKVFLVR
jgi:hypothetical protein